MTLIGNRGYPAPMKAAAARSGLISPTSSGKKIIGSKLVPVEDSEYKFGAELLFFQ